MSEVRKVNEVPPPPVPFLGRTQELDYLLQVVRPGACVALTSASGTDGVGKTALAQAFSEATTAFDLVCWWSVPLDGDRPHLALQRWAKACDASVKGLTALPQLIDALAASLPRWGRVLLVLDGIDVHHLDAAREILSLRGPHLGVLCTAERSEVCRQLGARPVMVEPLLEEEGEALLEAVAESGVPRVIAHAVLESVAWHPLGVRLAGTRLRSASAEESTGMFGGRIDPKRVAWLGGPAGVARGFLDAYRRLPSEEQRAFRGLAVFAHGPLRPARVAPIFDADTHTTSIQLARLAECGLLQSAGAGMCWQLHPLLRSFAERLAGEADELTTLRARRLSRVIASASTPDPALVPVDVLDVVEDAIRHGDDEDVIALATRIGESLAGWCHEAAKALLEEASRRAEATGHRAGSLLAGRLTVLRELEASFDDEVELELELVDDEDLAPAAFEPPLALEEPGPGPLSVAAAPAEA